MYFKLQKAHEQYNTQQPPVEIHGLRVRRTSDQSIEAEMALCFQYDDEANHFNLFLKRMNAGSPERLDLVTSAKVNTVWNIEIRSEKSRSVISAVLTNSRGDEFVYSMPYNTRVPVWLQSILPVHTDEPEQEPVTQPDPANTPQPGPIKTLIKMWYEFRAKKKKAVQQRRTGI